MDEWHTTIQKLSGSQARSLLVHVMNQIKVIKESKGSQEEVMEKLSFLHDRILGEVKNDMRIVREYETVHIVCGESAAGSLKVGLGRENKIIGFPDFFAIGPICELQQEAGRTFRYEWLIEHLNYPDDFLEEEYESRFTQTLAEMEAIPDHVRLVLWTGENADEQTGLRYLLYLLKEKPNDVYVINTTLAYKELFDTSEFQYYFSHTGEVHPEELNRIYQKKITEPLTTKERTQFEKEWTTLSETKGVVRIWEDHKIKEVHEDYFDELIVNTARKLHAKEREDGFMKAGRLIGEVYGQIDNHVGDTFLEYRLRTLLYKGVFEIKGIPKSMRHYSVKLK